MSTTTLRLPEELRARIERLTAVRGSTMHAFMIEAIAEVTDRAERQQAFEAEAEQRLRHMEETGEYITLDDLSEHMATLTSGALPGPATPRRMAPDELARFRSAMRRAR